MSQHTPQVTDVGVSAETINALISLPPGIKAVLEWTTGLIRVNADSEDYRLGKLLEAEWEDSFTTIVHETIHFLQIMASTKLYLYCCEMADELWEAASTYHVQITDELLTELRGSTKMNAIAGQVRVPDPRSGLTQEDVYEGAAYLCHSRVMDSGLDASGYDRRMSLLRGQPYARAYHYMRECLEVESVFLMLPPLAWMALQFSDPPQIFALMARALARFEGEITPGNRVELMEKVTHAVMDSFDSRPEIDFMRGPLDLAAEDRKLPPAETTLHPYYRDSLLFYDEQIPRGSLMRWLSEPETIGREFFYAVRRPMMFNDGVILIPEEFTNGLFDSDEEHWNAMLIYAALAFRVLGETGAGPRLIAIEALGDGVMNPTANPDSPRTSLPFPTVGLTSLAQTFRAEEEGAPKTRQQISSKEGH